jgi:type II secretory pathway component GspD/PulD (secretin)
VESTQDNAPVSVLINKTRVIADPLANSIIVIGPKEDKDKVDLLLDRLDNKPPQAYLSTVIGELTLDNSVNSGIDFLQKFKGLGTNQGYASSNLNSRTDIITKQNITDMRTNELTTPFGPLKGFNIYGQLSGALDTFVNMLETTSKFKVLSRPCVFALNNKKAVISSGQSIPYASSTTTNTNSATAASNGLVTATTDYKDVVLKLEVIPLIDPDGEITLKIAQVNDSLLGYATIGQNNAPIIGTEQLTTTVTVPSGNTVVLGGLIVDQYKKDTQGVPFISRIPLLGRLFKNDTRDKLRKELIIFIQPQVVNDDKMLRRMSLKEDLRSRVGGDAARIFPEVVIPVALPVEEPEPLLPGERQPGGKMKAIPASAAPPVQR